MTKSELSATTSQSTKEYDPFLHYSLSSNRIDILRGTSQTPSDGCDTDREAEEETSTRLSTEVHTLSIFELLIVLPDDREELSAAMNALQVNKKS